MSFGIGLADDGILNLGQLQAMPEVALVDKSGKSGHAVRPEVCEDGQRRVVPRDTFVIGRGYAYNLPSAVSPQ